jgi:hypothetical protein
MDPGGFRTTETGNPLPTAGKWVATTIDKSVQDIEALVKEPDQSPQDNKRDACFADRCAHSGPHATEFSGLRGYTHRDD